MICDLFMHIFTYLCVTHAHVFDLIAKMGAYPSQEEVEVDLTFINKLFHFLAWYVTHTLTHSEGQKWIAIVSPYGTSCLK